MKKTITARAWERALNRTKDASKDNLSSSEDEAEEIVLGSGEEQGDEEFINDGDLTRERMEIEQQEEDQFRIKNLLERAHKAKEQKSSTMFTTKSSNPRLFSKKKIEKVEPEVEAAERQALAEIANETEVVGFTKEDQLQHKYNMPAKLVPGSMTSPIKGTYNQPLALEGEAQVDPQLLEVLAECEEEEKEEAKRREEEVKERVANYAKIQQQRNLTPQKLERTRPLSTTPVKQQSQTVEKVISTAAVHGLDTPAQAVEVYRNDDGSIPFYWYDAHEIPNDRKGEIFLFGKVLDRRTGQHVSATVVVKGLERVYYAVPRGSQRIREIEDSGEGEEPEIDGMKIYSQIEQIRRTRYPGIHEWKCKMVSRSYAFELPLPHARPIDCLKIKYDAKYPPFMDTQGKSFEYMFGVNGSLLEEFLLKRKIMGPCWLTIKHPVIKHVRSGGEGVSWSRFEMETALPKNVECTADDKNKESPSLNAISIAVKVSRTFEEISPQKKGQKNKTTKAMPRSKEQIAMISVMHYHGLNIEHPTPSDNWATQSKQIREYTFVAKIEGSMLNFQQKMQMEYGKQKSGTQRHFFNSEKDMLTTFLARYQHLDPDILVAHNATSSVIELLVGRMQQVGVAHFSRIGKLKQTRLRTLTAGQVVQAGMWISRQAMIGRLLVDTTLSAQELVRETNYTLTHLVKTQMNEERQSFDQDRLQKIFASTPEQVMGVVEHTRIDSEFVLRLMLRLNVIPLTKKLTNIAGNLWYRSLQNARAERNQFLLLHHFKARKFLLPDKKTHKKFFKEEAQNEEEESPLKPRRQKAAYSGGLVLEPEIGFYDRFILLLDFNSLYPSIIREFNICFTTIKRPPAQQFDGEIMHSSFGETDVLLPDMESSTSKSVLPSILENLVTKRKTIKRQMKEKAAELSKRVKDPTTHPEYMQLDTAQKAYKLTANSIYGCLGFSSSRFFAKPLAALITRTGRDLLKQTVDLARHLEFPVIYGDTDSIMVDSRTREIKQAVEIASRLKREVNDQFKKSKKHRGLLEIDIDGVFQSLLLLRKKKYAALMLMNPFDVAADASVKPVLKRELKGLDAVRRDWSPLSSNVQKVILDMVLSGMDREELVSKVHQYFQKLKGDIHSGTVPLKDFLITKGLSRMPHQYRDVKGQPHVAVALRLMEQKKLHDNYIPYAICQGKTKVLSERAYHPDEIMANQGKSVRVMNQIQWLIWIGTSCSRFYLLSHVFQLLFNQGIDMKHIASLMGVDSRKFQAATEQAEEGNNNEEEDYQTQMMRGQQLEQRSKHLKIMTGFALKVSCPGCKITFEIEGPFQLHKRTQKFTNRISSHCPVCEVPLPEQYLHNRISYEMNNLMGQFYNGEHRCPELTCKKTTSMFSLIEDRCLWKGCQGEFQATVSDRKVDKCLQYLDTIFNVKDLPTEKQSIFGAENIRNAKQLRTRVKVVKSLSQYSQVELGAIFDFF